MYNDLVALTGRIASQVADLETLDDEAEEEVAKLDDQPWSEAKRREKTAAARKTGTEKKTPVHQQLTKDVDVAMALEPFFGSAEGRRLYAISQRDPAKTLAETSRLARLPAGALLAEAKLARFNGDFAYGQLVLEEVNTRQLELKDKRAIQEQVDGIHIPNLEESKALFQKLKALKLRADLAWLGKREPVERLKMARVAGI